MNFYDVIEEAESYFKTIDIQAKGSGYKQFMRWVNSNEYKYYPSGNRLSVDPAFAFNAFTNHAEENGKQANSTNLLGGWRELGPLEIDKITGHYAAGMGRVEDFHVDPNNLQNIYVCSRSGGLWKTTNGGSSWTSTGTETLPSTGVNSLAVDPLDYNHIYIALQNARNYYSYGIYESVDGGKTFDESDFNPDNLGLGGLGSAFRIYTVRCHPTIQDLLLIGTSSGLYSTTNNFDSWTQIIKAGSIVQVEFHPTNASVAYCYNSAERDYVYIVDLYNNTYTTTAVANNGKQNATLAVTASSPNEVFFASATGIYKSTNSGQSFSFVANAFSTLTGVGTDAFAVNSTDNQNLLIGGVDGANSTNGGLNFTKRTEWYLGNAIHGNGSLAQNYYNSNAYVHADLRTAKSVNGVFYVSTDGCLAKSEDDGVTWTNLMQTKAPPIRENYKLGISQSNNNVVICGSQDNGTSIKTETEWVEAYGADGMEGIILPLNPNYMIGSYQFGGRIRTLDAGKTNAVITSNDINGWWEAPLIFDPNDQFKIYDFRNGVYVSTDFGLNYTYVGSPAFLKSNPDNYWWQIRNAEIAQNNSEIIVVSRASEIEKSEDGGKTFSSIRNNLPNHVIQDIAFNPANDADIIAVNASYQNNGQKIYRSTNGGNSWSNITFNLGDVPVHSVVIDNNEYQKIYLGTEIGVYYMPLNGRNWTPYSTDLPSVAVEELEINHGANTIKASTWGRGLWEFDLVDRAEYPSIEKTTLTTPPTLNAPIEAVQQYVTSMIEYGGTLTSVEVKYSINNLKFNESIKMINTQGNVWTTEEALPNNLIIGDKVFFKVFATGSNNDVSETYKFMYEVRDFSYCQSQGLSGTGADYITEVVLGDFLNNSEQNYYTLYDNLEAIELIAGETYQLSVGLGYAFVLDTAAVWIDFNRDAVFEETELVLKSDYLNNLASGSFTVPNDAVANETLRMRVSNIYNSGIDPCGSAFGEVEDYFVKVNNGTSIGPMNENSLDVSVYNNPTTHFVLVEATEQIVKVELVDSKARIIIQQNNINDLTAQFNIGHLNEGLYVLNIYTKDQRVVRKIIKSN
ncbi:MAG: T9SS type A sorting domain-containing protein [Bacteroidia bacterium]